MRLSHIYHYQIYLFQAATLFLEYRLVMKPRKPFRLYLLDQFHQGIVLEKICQMPLCLQEIELVL